MAVTVSVCAVSSLPTVSFPSAVIFVASLAPPLTLQITSLDGLFSPVTVAVKVCSAPCFTFAVFGVTATAVTVGSVGWVPPFVTVTVAVSDFAASALDVAVTVSVCAVSSLPTVSFPSAVIFVASLVPPLTLQITSADGLFSPVTVAVKVCSAPCFTLAVFGVTATAVTVGSVGWVPPVVTVTVAVSDFAASALDVAVTVSVCAVSSLPTVSFPSAVIFVASLVPPLTLQITSADGLFSPVTVAVKVCSAPCFTLAVFGVTATAVTVGMPFTVKVNFMDLLTLASVVETDVTVTSYTPFASPSAILICWVSLSQVILPLPVSPESVT